MFNHAAFKPDDIDDARRGFPVVDLSGYGAARGLQSLGQVLVGHFGGLNPLWPNYVFNVLRGELVPGRFGTIQLELHEVALGDDGEPRGSGTYVGRRSDARPGLGSLVGLPKEPKDEPFAAQAMWIPTTAIKVLVPEAAVIPRVVAQSNAHASFTDPSLAPEAPAFRMLASRWISDELRVVIGRAIGPVLQTLGDVFVRLELAHGALELVVDGYRSDPGDLDRLVGVVRSLADALSEVARPWWVPGPFDAPLGPFDRASHPPGYRSFDGDIDRSGMDALARDAAAFGLVVEDPVQLHRRFPTLPLPGTSMGVLAGILPGTATFGRLSWQTQSHPGSSAYLRPAALMAVDPASGVSPAGGTLVASTDLYLAVRDGVACCWTRTNSVGRLDTAQLVERAVATFGEAGLIPR